MEQNTPVDQLPKVAENDAKIEAKPAKNVEMSKFLFLDSEKWAKCIFELKNYPELLNKTQDDFQVEFTSYNTFSMTAKDEESNKVFKYTCRKTFREYDVAGSKWELKSNGKLYISLKKTNFKDAWMNVYMP